MADKRKGAGCFWAPFYPGLLARAEPGLCRSGAGKKRSKYKAFQGEVDGESENRGRVRKIGENGAIVSPRRNCAHFSSRKNSEGVVTPSAFSLAEEEI